jgi:hypothetical protein
MKMKRLLTALALVLVVIIAGCKKDTFKETVGVCPLVVTTDPVNLATGVPLNKIITATFNEAMNPLTITPTSFTVETAAKGEMVVTGTVSCTGAVVTFTPSSALTSNTTYKGTLKSTIKDLKGNALQGDYVWTFTTGALPTVLSTDPANNAVNVLLNKIVRANFSVKMDPLTIIATTFTLKQGVTAVAGTVSYTDSTASFTPTINLLSGTVYTATVTTGAKSIYGIPMAADYVWTFTTGTLTAPTVTSTDPANNATGVAINKIVSANFSVPMDPLTLTATTFTLKQGATPVAGAVTYSGTTASFTPAANLTSGLVYTATVTTGAKNVPGIAMASDFVWSFTTGALIAPTVILTDPLNNATGVLLTSLVTATFSVPMDGTTITGTTFTLLQGVTPVAGIVSYSGSTATFTPSANLMSGSDFTATVTTGAKNVAGTPLTGNYVWTFSTGAKGPGIVNLGTAANFAAIGKSGISTTGTTAITGDIGVSPAAATAITGFGLVMDASNTFATTVPTTLVTGKVYASDYAPPTPAYMTTAVSDMETALTAALGMTVNVINDLGAGDISGLNLAPGLYKWSTGLLISNVGVTLTGGPNDTWVFQIAQDLTVNNSAIVTLAGGAQAKNIFWITSTQATLGTSVDFSGNILSQTLISLNTGAKVLGRLLAQTAVTLDAATVIEP